MMTTTTSRCDATPASTSSRAASTRRSPSRLSSSSSSGVVVVARADADSMRDDARQGDVGAVNDARSDGVVRGKATARAQSPTGVVDAPETVTTARNSERQNHHHHHQRHILQDQHLHNHQHRRVKTTPQLNEAVSSEQAYANAAYDDAMTHAERCVEFAPYWYRGYMCAAKCYFAKRDGDRAFEALERVLFLEPNMRADKEFREMYIELAQNGRC